MINRDSQTLYNFYRKTLTLGTLEKEFPGMATNIGKGFDIKTGKGGARTEIKRKAKFYTSTSAAIGAKKKPERTLKGLLKNRERTR